MKWKKGRGKLGIFQPLLGGTWITEADSPDGIGKCKCTRKFEKTLDGKYVQLKAIWEFPKKVYEEIAFFGVNKQKELCYWSFTSDGKQSNGKLGDAPDIHPDALCFEAQMDMGFSRQVYWPDENEGIHWAVETKTKKGWNRFVDHHYLSQE